MSWTKAPQSLVCPFHLLLSSFTSSRLRFPYWLTVAASSPSPVYHAFFLSFCLSVSSVFLPGLTSTVYSNTSGCSEPMGMKSRLVSDRQITASSTFRTWSIEAFTWLPHYARLDKQGKTNAWTAASNSRSEWLQVGDAVFPTLNMWSEAKFFCIGAAQEVKL